MPPIQAPPIQAAPTTAEPLFPVIGPFMALVWVGMHAWWPRQYWAYVSIGVVAFFVVFDAVGWGHVILPAYL